MIPVSEAMSCFWKNYAGTVILNRLKGIEVNETADARTYTSAQAKTGISWFATR